MSAESTGTLPPHVEDAARLIAELSAEQNRTASRYRRSMARLVEILGRARSLFVAISFVVVWIVSNVALQHAGRHAFDPPPFSFLQGILSSAALFMTVLILAAQGHETRLADHRAQLTLQLSMVSEQKIAKLIAILEEQRRDSAHLSDRIDHEAVAMAERTDPKSMLDAVNEAHSELVNDV